MHSDVIGSFISGLDSRKIVSDIQSLNSSSYSIPSLDSIASAHLLSSAPETSSFRYFFRTVTTSCAFRV